jgi:hypothetical protein
MPPPSSTSIPSSPLCIRKSSQSHWCPSQSSARFLSSGEGGDEPNGGQAEINGDLVADGESNAEDEPKPDNDDEAAAQVMKEVLESEIGDRSPVAAASGFSGPEAPSTTDELETSRISDAVNGSKAVGKAAKIGKSSGESSGEALDSGESYIIAKRVTRASSGIVKIRTPPLSVCSPRREV